jgi:hypothetical protein
MKEIIEMIEVLKQDKGIIIDDELIKQYIEDNIDLLVQEIAKEVR